MVDRILQGDTRAIAQAISLVENDTKESAGILHAIFPNTGGAYRIGITGPPGVGKSTLTNKLSGYYRINKLKVGIIAVDPTSPFTGGAILGDRIRMSDLETDEGVFIRSMASRGSLGGLSRKTKEAADILDAAGYDIILIETEGVGQSELDIINTVDTTIVVLVPESGDGIQAMKAGLMEIADLFVMNKADRPGSAQAAASIASVLEFHQRSTKDWHIPVVIAQANEGKGIDEVAAVIDRHRSYLHTSNGFIERRKSQLKLRIVELINEQMKSEFWTPGRTACLDRQIEKILTRSLTPYDAAKELFSQFKQR
ncbi:MAG: methylmalonyl Co-A mutase-associated GTPase MeaB [Bacteroidetes bacterium]|nr:methylmalonyl Co-A mutase-associated GTPase MeaB [Bacteroidota bacterium]